MHYRCGFALLTFRIRLLVEGVDLTSRRLGRLCSLLKAPLLSAPIADVICICTKLMKIHLGRVGNER